MQLKKKAQTSNSWIKSGILNCMAFTCMQVRGTRMTNLSRTGWQKHQTAGVLTNHEAPGLCLFALRSIYIFRARFHQQCLSAEASTQLQQGPCTSMEVPGAPASPSRSDEEGGTVGMVVITAQWSQVLGTASLSWCVQRYTEHLTASLIDAFLQLPLTSVL